jgi:glycerate dehydrogenase
MLENRVVQVVWLEKDSFRVALPRPTAPHVWTEYDDTPPESLMPRIAPADVLIVNKCKIGPAELDACPHLKMIAITATGTDNVDLNACEARGITVRNVVNYGAHAVAEHVMASLLTLTRHVREWSELAHNGTWSDSRFFCLHTHPMRSLSSQTLGILGSGAIGQQLALFAKAFGMSVIRLERQGAQQIRSGYVPFEQGLKTVDALSLHCPLNPDTKGLINRNTLALMKPDAIVLNTARGGLIVFEDLLDALHGGRLGGAAIDVLDIEPPPKNHVMVKASHPRLLLTPHIAWATIEAQTTLVKRVKQNIDAFLSGRPK